MDSADKPQSIGTRLEVVNFFTKEIMKVANLELIQNPSPEQLESLTDLIRVEFGVETTIVSVYQLREGHRNWTGRPGVGAILPKTVLESLSESSALAIKFNLRSTSSPM